MSLDNTKKKKKHIIENKTINYHTLKIKKNAWMFLIYNMIQINNKET